MKLGLAVVIGSLLLWIDVAHADEVTAVLPPLPPPKEAPPAKTVPVAAPEQLVFVTLESPSPVRLEREVGRGWVRWCDYPCNAEIPEGTYRVAGVNVKESAPFPLHGPEPVTLAVTPASKFKAGAVGVLFGPVIAVASGALTVMAMKSEPETDCGCDDDEQRTTFAYVGITGVLLGTVIFGAGLDALVHPGPKTTRVDIHGATARAVATVRSRALPSWRAVPSSRASGGGTLTLLRF